MGKLLFWNRLCGIVISAGMLTSVLCFSGCKASKASSTAVRLDSMRYNVTVVSTIEPVPMNVTDLVLTPDHLTRLTQLPKGYSLVASSDEGVDLRVESNGSGDLLVVAEAPMMSIRKDSIVQDIETHIRDETQNLETTTGVLPSSDNTWAVVFLIAAILIYVEIKFKD